MKALCQPWGWGTHSHRTHTVPSHMHSPVFTRLQFSRCHGTSSESHLPILKCLGIRRQCQSIASSTALQSSDSVGQQQDEQPQKTRLARICRSLAVGLAVAAWLKISLNRPASLFCSATVATSSGSAPIQSEYIFSYHTMCIVAKPSVLN